MSERLYFLITLAQYIAKLLEALIVMRRCETDTLIVSSGPNASALCSEKQPVLLLFILSEYRKLEHLINSSEIKDPLYALQNKLYFDKI